MSAFVSQLSARLRNAVDSQRPVGLRAESKASLPGSSGQRDADERREPEPEPESYPSTATFMVSAGAPSASTPLELNPVTGKPTRPLGAGEQLRMAREAAGLRPGDVARRLHLNERVIVALEQDRYEGLPAPTFVRGYLVSYARMLNIPVEPVVEAFRSAELSAPQLQLEIDNGDTRNARETRRGGMPWLTLGAAVAVFAGYAVWESGTRSTPTDVGPDATPSRAAAPPAASAALPPRPSAVQGAITRQFAPVPAVPADSASRTTARPQQAETSIAAVSLAGAAVAATAAPAPTSSDVAASQGSQLVGAGGLARLKISFAAESWVEIHDVNGRRLFWDLAKAGRDLQIEGEPPLKVLVGKADGARVTYGDVQVNIAGFVRRGMARFILDADSATPRPWPR